MSFSVRRLQPGQCYEDVLLAPFTTWRIGGPAKRCFLPKSSSDLSNFLAGLSGDEDLFYLGLGSNLLVRDGGYDGTVIMMHRGLRSLELHEQDIRVEAGVACAKVARASIRHGLLGIEFLAGIPGTIGGALAMNAGAFGSEIWQHVSYVETMDRKGHISKKQPSDFQITYRQVVGLEDELFLAAHFKLQRGDASKAKKKLNTCLQQRLQTQPIDKPSCGSVFKNPEGHFAAALIEASGLKGHRLGGAEISSKHANFIVNVDKATAHDVEALIQLIENEIGSKHDIQLQREVRIIGHDK